MKSSAAASASVRLEHAARRLASAFRKQASLAHATGAALSARPVTRAARSRKIFEGFVDERRGERLELALDRSLFPRTEPHLHATRREVMVDEHARFRGAQWHRRVNESEPGGLGVE